MSFLKQLLFGKKEEAPVKEEKKTVKKEEKAVKKEEKAVAKTKKAEKREAAIASVMEKTDWTYEEAKKNMKDAKKRIGITYVDYNKYNFHKIPEDLQQGKYQQILNKKSIKAERKEKAIEETMEKTGWSREETVANIRKARAQMNISWKEYAEYEFYKLTEEEQQEKYQDLLEEKEQLRTEKKESLEQKRKEVIEKVMEKTGWNYNYTKEEIEEAKERTGCTYEEYLTYKFYELPEEVQDEIFLMSLSKKIYRKYTANREFGKMLCDKAATNRFFADFIRRPWCMNSDISFEEFKELFINSKKIVYKPLSGHWGQGVTGREVNEENIKEVYDEIMSFPEGVVEEFVRQHSRMNELSPTAVNTVRLCTISSNTRPVSPEGNMMEIAYASLKIGGVKSSIVDNLHGGGMVAAIDLETGELKTNAADDQGNVYDIHPVTGTKIKGFKVPCFEEAVEIVTNTIKEKKLDGYLGWDIAITDNGPVLIELNLRPGVILASVPHIEEKRGIKKHMERYYLAE